MGCGDKDHHSGEQSKMRYKIQIMAREESGGVLSRNTKYDFVIDSRLNLESLGIAIKNIIRREITKEETKGGEEEDFL